MQTTTPSRVLTGLDHARLTTFLDRPGFVDLLPEGLADTAQDLLDWAEQVEAIAMPADVVSMRSQVQIQDERGETRLLTLVYPGDADGPQGLISVFSPLGLALLGASVGQAIEWRAPNGEIHRARVETLLYQPEANGDHKL